MIVLWNVVLKKINKCTCEIRKKTPSANSTTKHEAVRYCTLDTILKNTKGDAHYEDFILTENWTLHTTII